MPAPHTGGTPAWLAEHALVKNADYREMFAVTRDAETRELRRVTLEGYLRMEEERRQMKEPEK